MSYRTGYTRSRDLPYRGAPSVAPLGQRGITGTYLSGGQITGKEQNLRITGQNWIREAEEMQDDIDWLTEDCYEKDCKIKEVCLQNA